MTDPARKVFGAATGVADSRAVEFTPGVVAGPDSLEEEIDLSQERRERQYEQWVHDAKIKFADEALKTYKAIGVDDATIQTYLNTLASMLESIFADPDDLFIKIIDADFKRAAGDMTVNATRGDLTWPDIYRVLYPRPPDPVAGVTNTGDGSGYGGSAGHVTEEAFISQLNEYQMHYYYRNNNSMEGYDGWTGPVSAEDASYQSTNSGNGDVGGASVDTDSGATDAGDGPDTSGGGDFSWDAVNAPIDIANQALRMVAEAVSDYDLSPPTVDFLRKFTDMLRETWFGWDWPGFPSTGGTASAGNSPSEEVDFLLDNVFQFEDDMLRSFRSALEQFEEM